MFVENTLMQTTNELEYRIYTQKSEADKGIHTLKGILLGINLDGIIDEKEIKELHLWANTHRHLVNRNPFREFMLAIETMITGNDLNTETVKDLYWLTQKYEQDSYYYKGITTDLQILHGLCHGILANGVIAEDEIKALDAWLTENDHLATYYPYDEICTLLNDVLQDGIVDEQEKLMLMAYFKQFAAIKNTDTLKQIEYEVRDVRTSAICSSDINIDFDGKVFCVTGQLRNMLRDELHTQISNLGGLPKNTVTKQTNYLIVGADSNPAWCYACFGRKVEKAQDLRKQGQNIAIIHENDLMDAIRDFGK